MLKLYLVQLLILLILYAAHYTVALRSFEVIFVKATCTVHSKKIQKFDCFVNNTRKELSSMSASMVPAVNIYPRNVRSRIDFLNTNKPTSLIDHVLDLCDAFDGLKLSSGVGMMLNQMRNSKMGNLPKKCPLAEGEDYFVKDLHLDPEKLPPYIPIFKFNYTAIFRETDIPLAQLELLGEVRKRSKGRKH